MHGSPVAQTILAQASEQVRAVTQISQGQGVMILLFHTLMILHSCYCLGMQNNKKRRKKQLGEARKQAAEGATLKKVSEIRD